MKKILVTTGGGDCPGLNAVIRGIVKRGSQEKDLEIWGSFEALNGIMEEPTRLIRLDEGTVSGIHVRGGTILGTTNKGNPLSFPEKQPDGTTKIVNRIPLLVNRLKDKGFDAVINIGGDGSQAISQAMFEAGMPVVGVPKTIDNDLSSTDFTFGFQTAVQTASDSFDRLVTTANSHHRVMIMEVMGRHAGWIALYTAISGGAEICLIPEIPYNINAVVDRIKSRYNNGRGFVNIVIAEGAHAIEGSITSTQGEEGRIAVRLGGVCYTLSQQLKDAGVEADIRETVLGHTQRGGTPIAFDRVIASVFGVKAIELVLAGKFGQLVVLQNNDYTSVPIQEAISAYNVVDPNGTLVQAAKGLGISFGD
ncbi:6-phosphofructokinase [Algoriphagus boritolerans]|uniref:ATP-dependent 6-phosphofructokinase n=1 Tax=Algoriphagus boritolerans DSM 17298 = JCM 18970 TaxID=1120964 RepID=A0A1H5YIY9_9BACT|nr:ATP-dependent 6-phosphofructokinase [Algoriphagus boritolerans]SEG23575.1 6-phosphofructokinase 1 [Algoriphagus boritolerans DSM 17298 = JCM 18970]